MIFSDRAGAKKHTPHARKVSAVCGSPAQIEIQICCRSQELRIYLRIHRDADLRQCADLSAEIRRHFRFCCNEYILFSPCYLQTAGENDKTRICHVITTGQWRSAPQIRPAPHFVESHFMIVNYSSPLCLCLLFSVYVDVIGAVDDVLMLFSDRQSK